MAFDENSFIEAANKYLSKIYKERTKVDSTPYMRSGLSINFITLNYHILEL